MIHACDIQSTTTNHSNNGENIKIIMHRQVIYVIQKYHTERRLGVWINKISVKGKRDLFTTTQLLAESSQPGGMQTKLRALVILSAVLATY